VTSRAPREVLILARAARDIDVLLPEERAFLVAHIDRLVEDGLPRGAATLDGRHRDHLRWRVGRYRVIYRFAEGVLTVVAVTVDPG
jgi:mRNA-degrading endonuclease RelE of RelBE toxin-antitoxin system